MAMRAKVVTVAQSDSLRLSQGFKAIEWAAYVTLAAEKKWDTSLAKIEYCRVPGKAGRHKCALIPKDNDGFFDVELAVEDKVESVETLLTRGKSCNIGRACGVGGRVG